MCELTSREDGLLNQFEGRKVVLEGCIRMSVMLGLWIGAAVWVIRALKNDGLDNGITKRAEWYGVRHLRLPVEPRDDDRDWTRC